MCLINCCCFSNWDSLHARLNSHYEARSYNKKKYKEIKTYKKSVYKDPTDKKYLFILDLIKHSMSREFLSLAVWGKKLLTMVTEK